MMKLLLYQMPGKCISIFHRPGYGLFRMVDMYRLWCLAMKMILHDGHWNFCKGDGDHSENSFELRRKNGATKPVNAFTRRFHAYPTRSIGFTATPKIVT